MNKVIIRFTHFVPSSSTKLVTEVGFFEAEPWRENKTQHTASEAAISTSTNACIE